MSTIIEDGKGKGNKAHVDDDNRIHARSVTASDLLATTIVGEAYIAGTGTVDVTNDTENYLLYVKNDSELDLVIHATNVVSGESTGGASNELTFLGKINPTGGTIISSGTPFAPFNLNLGSANVFNGTAHVAGSLGLTGSGGTQASGLIHGPGRHTFESTFILPKGASLTGGIQAATGNTSVKVSIGYTIYFRNKDNV